MAKKVYISVISHNQEDLIKENFYKFPKRLGKFEIKLSVLDNTGSSELKRFCQEEDFFYHTNSTPEGFGANHNKMFELLQPESEDVFIISNPDIKVLPQELSGLVENFIASDTDVGAPRSYLDKESAFLDFPDRYFPYLGNFIVSILTGKRLHYGSDESQEYPQWISGSFILFKPDVFRALGGFDEGYFMYCEDIDLCYRAKKQGYRIKLDTSHYIEHHSRMDSRKLFSKSILWHMRSALRFSMKTKRIFGLQTAK